MDEGERLAAEELAVWWTQFEDEQLTGLVQRSLDANLTLAAAAARVEETLALRGVAAGERVPSVNGTAGLFERRLSDASGGVDGNRDFTFSSVGIDASWELDLWGRIRRTVEAADATAQAGLEDFRGVRASIAAQVVVNYLRLRELQLRQQLAEENIARQQETLTLTQGRFDAGLVPKLDVEQAALNLARTEAVLPRLRQSEAETLRALEILSGNQPGALMQELGAHREVPLPESSNLRDLPANIIRRRPDLRSAEQQLLAAAARVGVARAELYPRISLTGSFAWEARDGGDLFGGDSLGYSVGPGLLMPVFQGGRLRSQVDAAEARATQAELSYRQQVLEALGEVENALTAYQQEQIRLGKLQDGVNAAETTVVQVRSLYENGLVTFLNVLDAERNLAAVQDEAAASLGQTARNLAGVYRAFGGGWDAPEFEEMSGQQTETRTVLSTQTAVVALQEKGDKVWTFTVVQVDSFTRSDPAASGMVDTLELPENQLPPALADLLPGERARLTWREEQIRSQTGVRTEPVPVSAERLSVE
jgi:NodT family efflux transporter outer membrane factor (OMF) lipoprotein